MIDSREIIFTVVIECAVHSFWKKWKMSKHAGSVSNMDLQQNKYGFDWEEILSTIKAKHLHRMHVEISFEEYIPWA